MDVLGLPPAENDEFEFKSSQTPLNELKKKLARAVSGFANSGGGWFVAGVNDAGDADGGFVKKIGQTDVRDWIDQVVHAVEPTPNYDVELIDDPAGRGTIHTGHVVIAVQILGSERGPHMSTDNRYYIRAGAHTVPARHFIVEAIWARRHLSKPRLVHLTNWEPIDLDGSGELTISIVATTDSPAFDVTIDIASGTNGLGTRNTFPLTIPMIDRANSFSFCLDIPGGGAAFSLSVNYTDLAGNRLPYDAAVDSKTCKHSRRHDPLVGLRRELSNLRDALRENNGALRFGP